MHTIDTIDILGGETKANIDVVYREERLLDTDTLDALLGEPTADEALLSGDIPVPGEY